MRARTRENGPNLKFSSTRGHTHRVIFQNTHTHTHTHAHRTLAHTSARTRIRGTRLTIEHTTRETAPQYRTHHVHPPLRHESECLCSLSPRPVYRRRPVRPASRAALRRVLPPLSSRSLSVSCSPYHTLCHPLKKWSDVHHVRSSPAYHLPCAPPPVPLLAVVLPSLPREALGKRSGRVLRGLVLRLASARPRVGGTPCPRASARGGQGQSTLVGAAVVRPSSYLPLVILLDDDLGGGSPSVLLLPEPVVILLDDLGGVVAAPLELGALLGLDG